MQVQTVETRQKNATITQDGQQKAAFFASWRQDGLSLNVDVFDAEWAGENADALADAFASFWEDALSQAALSGLPLAKA